MESLDYSESDKALKKILHFLLIGIFAALGGLFFALIIDRFCSGAEAMSVGIGMYICILIVICTGILLTRLKK